MFRIERFSRRTTAPRLTGTYAPMLLSAAAEPFTKEGWFFEPKLDGMRTIAEVTNGSCRLWSRNGLDFSQRYPGIASALGKAFDNVVLDGEIIAVDAEGMPNFELLQRRIVLRSSLDIAQAESDIVVFFYAFDVLEHDGDPVFDRQLSERKALLDSLMPVNHDLIKVTETFEDGISLFAACAAMGLEGIVAKRADSRYRPGTRSKDWIKIKKVEFADAMICGHLKDAGFLVGSFEDGKLIYRGAVASGLTSEDVDWLEHTLEATDDCPLSPRVRLKNVVWFKPNVAAHLKFMHYTSGGVMRHPSFVKLYR